MSDNLDNPTLPQTLQRISNGFRRLGWISFWIQLGLAVIATVIFLLATITPSSRAAASDIGRGGGLLLALGGLSILYFSIYLAFRYVIIGRQLRSSNPALRPRKHDTIKTVRFHLWISIIGMICSIGAAEAITGLLLAKSLNQAQGAAILNDPGAIITSLDLFVVLANTHTITAHFSAMLVTLWLLDSTTKTY